MGGVREEEVRAERFGEPLLRVPKERVAVELLLEGGERLTGDLFVACGAAHHQGRERVCDLLVAGDPFLPFDGEGGPSLLGVARIVAVRVHDRAEAGIEPAEANDHECPVRIELAGMPEGQATLEGILPVAMPQGRERPIDQLNDENPIVAIVTGDGATIVAKRYIRRVVTLD